MTRQQQFAKLCAELEKASDYDHPARPSSIAEAHEKLREAKERLAWFVYRHQDIITVKSDVCGAGKNMSDDRTVDTFGDLEGAHEISRNEILATEIVWYPVVARPLTAREILVCMGVDICQTLILAVNGGMKSVFCRCIPNLAAAIRDGVDHDQNVSHPVTACACRRCMKDVTARAIIEGTICG